MDPNSHDLREYFRSVWQPLLHEYLVHSWAQIWLKRFNPMSSAIQPTMIGPTWSFSSILACSKYTGHVSTSFKPIFDKVELLESLENSAILAWTNPCIASLIFLARALVIGPSGTCKGSRAWDSSECCEELILIFLYSFKDVLQGWHTTPRRNSGVVLYDAGHATTIWMHECDV